MYRKTTEQQLAFVAPKQKSYIAETRDRLKYLGPKALSNEELITLLTGSPLKTANLFKSTGRLLRDIAKKQTLELEKIPKLGPAGAAQLLAAFELGRRLQQEDMGDRPQITSPVQAKIILEPELLHQNQERLVGLYLDTKNKLIKKSLIYQGNVNTSIVRVAEILKPAITLNAVAMIVGHNHPSGDPTPSPEDLTITQKLKEASELIDIELLDHVIIGTSSNWISLKEKGLW